MRYLLSPRVMGLGVLFILGGISAVTAKNGNVAGGVLLVLLGASVTGLCVWANIAYFIAMRHDLTGSERELSPYRDDPVIMARFRITAYVMLAAAGAAFAAAIWLLIPDTSTDAFLVLLARIIALGFLPLLWNGLLANGAFSTLGGLVGAVRRNVLWLRIQWILALVVVADGVLTHPTDNWPTVVGCSAVVVVTSLAADLYTRRFLGGLPTPAAGRAGAPAAG